MVLKKQLILAPTLIVASALLLSGCSTPAEQPAPSPANTSPAPNAEPTPSESPAGEDEVMPEGKLDAGAVVEGNIPTGGAAIISEMPSEDGSSVVYTFEGDASNIAALKEIFETSGFIWNDPNGDSSSILASGVNSNLSIDDMGDGTYTYTVFKGE
jgi:hypothetical protein